jgi:hypothetical protein
VSRTLAWAFLVPDTLDLINSNNRSHWAVNYRKARDLRLYGQSAAQRLKIPTLSQASVTVVVHPGVRTKKFDPSNWAPTAKALMDGMTDARVWVDDDSKHVVAVTYIAGTRRRKTAVELRVVDVSGRSKPV